LNFNSLANRYLEITNDIHLGLKFRCCNAENRGHVALVRPGSEKLDIVSEFQITKGEGPFWAHPVISKGRLYMRHGDYLMVYQIK